MPDTSATVEEVRRYWDAQPCNVHHSDATLGSAQYFDEVSRRKYFVEPHIRRFADFERWRGKSVLELGCGIGTDAESFAQSGAIYTGVELSKESLRLARTRFELRGLKGTFVLGNAEQLRDLIPVRHFDLIYSFGVIHHTPEPQAVVDGVLDYMGEGSEFRLMLYATDSWKGIMIEAGLDQPEARAGCPVARTFTRSEVFNLLRRYGSVSIEQDHIFPYVVDDYINYRYTLQPWFRSMSSDMFRALERRLGWHLLVTARKGM